MNKEFICIICPNSCQVTVEFEKKKVLNVYGALCPKGKDFVINEIYNPLRLFTGSVTVRGGDFTSVSVKSTLPIPRKYLKKIGRITHLLKIKAPIRIGQVIANDLLDKEIKLIATRNVKKKTD